MLKKNNFKIDFEKNKNDLKKDKDIISLKKHIFLSSFFIILLIFIDQYTKFWAKNNFQNKDNLILIRNVLEFTFLKNTGAAFSFMSNNSFFRLIMGIITPIFCIYMFYLLIKMYKSKNNILFPISIILIISGAIGNYIDRMVNSYVIDFIYFSLINFPVFNVADTYVSVGFFLLILLIFFNKEEDILNIIK